MSKYLAFLNEGKEAKEQKQNQLAAANAKSSVEKYISGKKARATELAAAREQFLGTTPFSVDRIVDVDNQIAQNNKELATAESLLEELF